MTADGTAGRIETNTASGEMTPVTHVPLATRLRRPHGRPLALARLGCVALAGLALALFAVGVPRRYAQFVHPPPALHAALERLGLTPGGYALAALALDMAVVALFALIGLTLLWRAPDRPMALLGGLMLVLLGVVVLSNEIHTLDAGPPPLAALGSGLALATVGTLVLFSYAFPDGRFTPRWTRWAALAWLAFYSSFTLLHAFLAPERWPPALYLAVVVVLWGTFPVAQVYRYRRVSDLAQRQQTKWVAYGITMAIAGLLVTWIALAVLNGGLWSGPPPTEVGAVLFIQVLQDLCLSIIPACVALAVLRRRLWDIDLVIYRTLVYAALTALVGGLYVLLVGGLGALLPARGNLLASLAATGLIAALFTPARLRVQRAVNRLLYGQRDEPYAVLARLGARLDAALAPEAVLPTIVATITHALKLPYAAIALADDPATLVAAGDPAASATVTVVPLTYQGAPVGEFGAADRRLLDDLAHHAGAAVHGVRLQRELRAALHDLQGSRERLVTAREEERRRLRRDLHDELAPTLAALALTAGTAQDLLTTDPATAARLMDTLHGALRESVGQVRRLVDDLRPPTLDELGLEAAIRERAAQVAGSGEPGRPRVVVEFPASLPPLPAAVEVAAYRIVQEALMNVVKHAHAHTCAIQLAQQEARPNDRALRVEISDDGVGLPAAPRRGVGLGSMRERAAELGGALAVARGADGGTCVVACLPLPAEEGM